MLSPTDTLVILGRQSELYNLNWSPKSKATTVVRLGYYEDETADNADWTFPGGALSRILGRCDNE